MLTSSPTAPTGPASALATYLALINQLSTLSDTEFADLVPDGLDTILVPVTVRARVVAPLRHPAPGSSNDGSCIAGTAAHGQGGTVPSDSAN